VAGVAIGVGVVVIDISRERNDAING
jgi:hypothetical protein